MVCACQTVFAVCFNMIEEGNGRQENLYLIRLYDNNFTQCYNGKQKRKNFFLSESAFRNMNFIMLICI